MITLKRKSTRTKPTSSANDSKADPGKSPDPLFEEKREGTRPARTLPPGGAAPRHTSRQNTVLVCLCAAPAGITATTSRKGINVSVKDAERDAANLVNKSEIFPSGKIRKKATEKLAQAILISRSRKECANHGCKKQIDVDKKAIFCGPTCAQSAMDTLKRNVSDDA